MARVSSGSKSSSSETLIKNLRILELDEEFDWPGIRPDTFAASSGAQDQQKRSYAAQWLLYKMFLLWDSDWTKDALQDLFPPLESKQAIELRLRIYKQFVLLKQNGTFANDLVLRRTMFDDCKGPKFEELLATFSSLVLQRVVCKSDDDHSLVRKMAEGELRLEKDLKMPLILAYQSSFGMILTERHKNEQRWSNLAGTLATKEAELHSASARLEDIVSRRQEKRIPKRTLDRLQTTVERNWVGDKDWTEILLQSDQLRPQGTFLERAFSSIWPHVCRDTLYNIQPQRNESLLQELQSRVECQNERLASWRSVREKLLEQLAAIEFESLQLSNNLESVPIEESLPPRPSSKSVSSPESVISERPVPSKLTRQRSASTEEVSLNSMSFEAPQAEFAPVDETGHIRELERPRLQVHPRATSPCAASVGAPIPTRDALTLADHIISTVANATPTPAKVPFSLAERTRLSMAKLSSPQKRISPLRDILSTESPAGIPSNSTRGASLDPKTPDTYASLAERTRQSMSQVKVGPYSKPTRKPRVSRVSNVYPVNQFETPRKAAPSISDSPEASILEERLDALAVNEESAFQSRPLLAKSPHLRPQSDTIQEDPEDIEEFR